MNQLRFTTTSPSSMFEPKGKPLILPEDRGEVFTTNLKLDGAYIDAEAERLAGFDIPLFLDGHMAQLDAPIKDQDILMMLPSGNYPCIAEKFNDEYNSYYLLHLKE